MTSLPPEKSNAVKPPSGTLDLEVVELLQDEADLLAVADAVARTYRPKVERRRSLRRLPSVAIAATIAVVLIAPAYAIVRYGTDFFSNPPASKAAITRFDDLRLSPSTAMNPRVLASQARLVATFQLADGTTVELSVAPTKQGGFCEDFSGFTETCDADRTNPFDVGLAAKRLPGDSVVVFGDVLSAKVAAIELQLHDGKTLRIPLIRVSAPINAAFFFHEISAANQPVEALALDPGGNELSRHRITGTLRPPP